MEPDLRLRRASFLAALAFVAVALALALPWWRVTNELGDAATTEEMGVWGGGEGWVRPGVPYVTAGLAALALPILFVRVAARSWKHEPHAWRRDLVACIALLVAAAASCWAWPLEGAFWGSDLFPVEGGDPLHVRRAPGPGWWLALTAAALLGWARHWSRPARAPP